MKNFKLIIALSFIGPAAAVNINPGGYGEAIILPYYTVNNGLNTLLTINNSTDKVKAVKIHFREGKAGKSVLSFNMFLAPQDVWVAGLVPHVSDLPGHIGQQSAAIVHNDQSCAPYLLPLQQFLPYEVDAESEDSNLKRSREGYIEILEMGELDPNLIDGLGEAATFTNSGEPKDCGAIEAAYSNDGIWNETNGDYTEQLLPISGGISASVGIIDVAEGTLYSYDGVAFEDFYPADSVFHTSGGDTRVPSMDQADTTSHIIDDGELVSTQWEHGYQAISALLIKKQVESFYNVEPNVAAKTEVVFSFPTKRLYATDESPFAENGVSQAAGCASYDLNVFDRESANLCDNYYSLSCAVTQAQSPPPPPIYPQMCGSINVLQVLAEDSPLDQSASKILGSEYFDYRNILVGESGKFYVDFDQSVTAPSDVTYSGVPVIALAFEKYTNAGAAPGLLAQYGGIYSPKFKTEID